MKRFALILALVAAPAFGKTVKGTATFETHSMAGLNTITGTGAPVSCTVDVKDGKASGSCEADLSKLTTGMDLRDDHMKNKYLETGKFPTAKLVFADQPAAVGDFAGSLTLKGQTSAVKGSLKVDGTKLHAEFPVTFADFPAVGAPEFKGVGVDKTVLVKVDGTVAD